MSVAMDESINDEVEAIQAILMENVVVTTVDGMPLIETVIYPSLTDGNIDQRFVCVTLQVKLIEGYPKESPEVYLRNPRGLDDDIMNMISEQVQKKMKNCQGHPVIYEVMEVVRENLTANRLPSGQCVICLFGFAEGDEFIKTQCYHYFHSNCLAKHLIAGKKNYEEEMAKLPNWQRMEAAPYQQTCPVCRSPVSCDVEELKNAPLPMDSINAPPFRLTAELKALQRQMAALLAKQVAKGGVVGVGDNGPPPLTITTAADHVVLPPTGASSSKASPPAPRASATVAPPAAPPAAAAPPPAAPPAPAATPPSPQKRVPYRGFNRRGKPGRRGRGGR